MAKNVTTMGEMARFNPKERCLLHSWEADRISEQLSKAMRHTTLMMLASGTPTCANMLMADEERLRVLLLLIVLSIEDINSCLLTPLYLALDL
jgi:hypothetical protein